MDPLVTSRIFRRLFAHETCSVLRYSSPVRPNRLSARLKSTKASAPDRSLKDHNAWQHRYQFFKEGPGAESKRYPVVTADQLRSRTTRPKRVKMLMRDFIEDSLYNPHYGYFPKEAVIFSPPEPFDFRSMRDEADFERQFHQAYESYEDQLDAEKYNAHRQMWHTPVELFQPYFGESIARYMTTNYKISLYPYEDLVIYEMGAGNGTLMLNILDYIRAEHPEIYLRTQYRVIEISAALAGLQENNLMRTAESRGHAEKVTIINKSIFDWDVYVSNPCFFVALEVFDNFAHDCIRYEPASLTALQSKVVIDGDGELIESNEAQIDPVALRFLRLREELASSIGESPTDAEGGKGRRSRSKAEPLFSIPKPAGGLKRFLPGADRLSAPEFIPTRLMQFFDVLHAYFPAHRLVSCDFNRLPSEVEGVCAPVVQTRFERQMVQVSTPLVQQGYFDILFPTNFRLAEAMYRSITGKLTNVLPQEDFLARWAFIEDTRTRRGDNPLLNWYKNASVLLTV